MAEKTYEALVLGGGPAGYVCAIRLGQLGVKTACIEGEELGGVCLNWGCIPSKALISTAHLYEKAASAAEIGIMVERLRLDPNPLQDWKDKIVKKLTGGVRTLLKANGVDVLSGKGRLVARDAVEVTSKEGTQKVTATKAIVVATGSETIQIPGFPFDGERIIGAREAVSLRQIPKRLVVIGGGVIGLELGMVYQKFGTELTVVELTDSLLPGIDRECVKVVERHLKKLGATIKTDARAEGVEKRGDGTLAVRIVTASGAETVECDTVLVAVGMKPRSRDIGLEELGVELDPRGFVTTNDVGLTSVEGIYAIGDVSGAPMLAHKAMKEGEVIAEVIAGHRAGKDWVTVPAIVFTDPEIASVGVTEEAAKASGRPLRIGKFPFSALGRAMSIRETDGFVKVITDSGSGQVIGIHLVGPSASDLVSEAALALEMGATAEDLALTIHPHPTLGEALMEASMAALGKAVHIGNR
ncbi:MAG TPA: dihydrolipoyl dehydrogenase [Polyangiaceae bacterium]|jgi:dihydrolipoamide dehydrogenase|nr:dihydrolipoyl dehydrogenase [Polyangiaceae bacterium]